MHAESGNFLLMPGRVAYRARGRWSVRPMVRNADGVRNQIVRNKSRRTIALAALAPALLASALIARPVYRRPRKGPRNRRRTGRRGLSGDRGGIFCSAARDQCGGRDGAALRRRTGWPCVRGARRPEANETLPRRLRADAAGGEQGLLGLAFHPNFERNRMLYVNHTGRSGNSVIARYRTLPPSGPVVT